MSYSSFFTFEDDQQEDHRALGAGFVLLCLVAEARVTGVSGYFNLCWPVSEPSSWPGAGGRVAQGGQQGEPRAAVHVEDRTK